MGKYKPFIVLGLAITVALVTSGLTYNWVQKRTKEKKMASLKTEPVAVAMIDLSWGTVITKEMIKVLPFLKESLPEGYFPDPGPLVGRVVIFPVKANEPIFESRLAPLEVKTGGVAAVIGSKKRAVAVKVDKVIGVSGFIHPGNRVDILVTMATDKTSAPVTKTVLENILVLAVGPKMEKKEEEEKPTNVEVITLEVAPEEAEKLALAATEGRLQLALRNFNDTEDVLTKGTTIPALLASYSLGWETPAVPRKVTVRRKARVSPKRVAPSNGVESRRALAAPGGSDGTPKTVATPNGIESEKPVPEKPPALVVELIKGGKVSEVKFEGRR